MSVKICISGKIAAGKTTLAQALAKRLDYQVVSFGSIIRETLKREGVEPTRDALHAKSYEIVASVGNYGAMDWFVANSPRINWGNNLIVEGCRNPETYQRMQELFPVCLLVHCSCSEPTQIQRIIKRDGLEIEKIHEIISRPVEEDLDGDFIKIADLINYEHTEQVKIMEELEVLLQNSGSDNNRLYCINSTSRRNKCD